MSPVFRSPHLQRIQWQVRSIERARQQHRIKGLQQDQAHLEDVMGEVTLRSIFHDRVVQIRNEISRAQNLRDLMRSFRDTLENLGTNGDPHPKKVWGVNVYRYSNQTTTLWSVARDKMQGDSRYYPDPAALKPGEKGHFLQTAKDRGYPGSPTDILLVDRLKDLEKMGPEDRAQTEADFECDLQKYFGADYREKFAGRLDRLKEALRYNLYVRWPGFDQYDLVIMANKHARNAQRIKDGLPPELLFRDDFLGELVFESLRDLQIPFTSELRKVENGRRAELRLLRGDALHKLQTALDQGQTPHELFEATLDLLPQLFPRSAEESHVERSSIMLFDEEIGRLTIQAARGLRDEIVTGTQLLSGENLAGRVFKTGESILILDAQARRDDIFLDRPSTEKIAKGACMSVPIRSEGNTYGVLNVRSRRIKAFREEELRFFQTIAGILANKMRRLTLQHRDEGTGLYRRGPGVDKINNMLEAAFSRRLPLSFMMIDLDRFKRINDTYGHKAGDEAVLIIAGLIQDYIRSRKKEFADHVEIRWGGDELAVALLGVNAEQAGKLAEELRELIQRQAISFLRKGDFITASFGVALYPDHGTNLEEVAHNADKAAYAAKRQRNKVIVYDPNDEGIRQTLLP